MNAAIKLPDTIAKTVTVNRIRGGKVAQTEIRYGWTRSPAGHPALTIVAGKSATTYLCQEIPADPEFRGRGFMLTKVGTAETYNVLVGANAQDSFCDCRGSEAHGRCKHVSVLYASWDRGELPGDEPAIEVFPSKDQMKDDASDFGASGAQGPDCPF